MATKSSQEEKPNLATALQSLSTVGNLISVTLSNELVHLLSDQLYQSPVKAVEELVINSYDADAKHCCVYVPSPAEVDVDFVAIFDDGAGMDEDGLTDLWQIGRSEKRREQIQKLRNRKQIGKFGIGKLAARTIANKLTYISKVGDKILSVGIDFNAFVDARIDETKGNNSSTPSEDKHNHRSVEPIKLEIKEIGNWSTFAETSPLKEILDGIFVNDSKRSWLSNGKTWTIAILEDLTAKARTIKLESLKRVLSTAMPLISEFQLFLNGKRIESSKEGYDKLVEFDIKDLPDSRIKDLQEATGTNWTRTENGLTSDDFPNGISGQAIVTRNSLYGQKSDDLARSHGFFVRVRGRVVNYSDPLFGLNPLTYEIFNRFQCDIEADDLDLFLKASREAVEKREEVENFRELLRAIFNEAFVRFNKVPKENGTSHKEGQTPEIESRLVEQPIADTLLSVQDPTVGPEVDDDWFYLKLPPDTDISALAEDLYANPRKRYSYQLTTRARTDRVVKLELDTNTFWINSAHEFVVEYASQGPIARRMLEDVVTAEALLEVYLRNCLLPLETIAEILEKRDQLLRSLAKDGSYSFQTIAQRLRDSSADQYELEISIVVAMRAIGLNAKHISGSGEPDGFAIFVDYGGDGERKVTLEAKSSGAVPTLAQLDFAGVREHMDDQKYSAHGCLLVAPAYPNDAEETSAVSNRSTTNKISCWTVGQLASFVAAAESRHFTASDLLKIVLNNFTPLEVSKAVDELLNSKPYSHPELYLAILKALRKLAESKSSSVRTVGEVYALVLTNSIPGIERETVREGLEQIAASSKGGLRLKDESVLIAVDLDELERRIAELTRSGTRPRRKSSFRENDPE